MSDISKETHCVHDFGEKAYQTRGLNTPIEPSSAFKYSSEEHNVYPRYFNTINQQVICRKIAKLEHAEDAIVFSSGMAAITTSLFSFLNSGDHAVFYSELYGGTFNLIKAEFERKGIEFTLVSNQSIEAFNKAVKENTKIVYFETPTNPLISIVDIDNIAIVAKERNLISIIDNTFASPINQNPIDFGIDLVIHSGTKYLGGHSDLSFGAIAGKKNTIDSILQTAINLGGNLNPLDCYLIERSLKTLDVRVKRQNENALTLAKYLENHKLVSKVFYPGLESHPMHDVAKKQMKGYGGMLSFELNLNQKEKFDLFLDSLQLVAKALSLGGVESTVCSPAETSHIKMTKEERLEIGVTDNLLRFSVGIENSQDLINDFNQAFAKIT